MNELNLIKRIKEAKDEALFFTDNRVAMEFQAALLRGFLEGKVTLRGFRYWCSANQDLRPGRISFGKVWEFRQALTILGMKEESLEIAIGHELRHYNTALFYGLEPKFGVALTKGKMFNFMTTPLIIFNFPRNYPEALAREALREILLAPGGDMSPNDLNCLPLQAT